jgi:hypothetical protein
VIEFDKRAMADRIDEGNNFDDRRVIVHARNACFDIAERLGLTHFIELDDDYTSFLYRTGGGHTAAERLKSKGRTIRNLDAVIEIMLDYFDAAPQIHALAISQGGDHIGGFAGERMKRKAMNFFLCSPARRFQFIGSINEDVNAYTRLASTGTLFMTYTGLQLNQAQTQAQAGGMTDIYLARGTYVKSFTSVLFAPSSVKVSMMGRNDWRIHHAVDWASNCPAIVPAYTKKQAPTAAIEQPDEQAANGGAA